MRVARPTPARLPQRRPATSAFRWSSTAAVRTRGRFAPPGPGSQRHWTPRMHRHHYWRAHHRAATLAERAGRSPAWSWARRPLAACQQRVQTHVPPLQRLRAAACAQAAATYTPRPPSRSPTIPLAPSMARRSPPHRPRRWWMVTRWHRRGYSHGSFRRSRLRSRRLAKTTLSTHDPTPAGLRRLPAYRRSAKRRCAGWGRFAPLGAASCSREGTLFVSDNLFDTCCVTVRTCVSGWESRLCAFLSTAAQVDFA